jgi:simple sugar transport system ATP-binding protein
MGAREARLIIDLVDRLRARGDIAIVMIAHNYAQTLEICDRVILVQHGEITFESAAGETSAAELLEIVRREYRAARGG